MAHLSPPAVSRCKHSFHAGCELAEVSLEVAAGIGFQAQPLHHGLNKDTRQGVKRSELGVSLKLKHDTYRYALLVNYNVTRWEHDTFRTVSCVRKHHTSESETTVYLFRPQETHCQQDQISLDDLL